MGNNRIGMIDWNKPARVMYRGIDDGPVTVIAEYGGKAFVTWGGMQTAHSVDAYGVFDVEYLGDHSIVNVPEEPKDHIVLIKIDGKDKWFFSSHHWEDHDDGSIASPATKTEATSWANIHPEGTVAVVKVPS